MLAIIMVELEEGDGRTRCGLDLELEYFRCYNLVDSQIVLPCSCCKAGQQDVFLLNRN